MTAVRRIAKPRLTIDGDALRVQATLVVDTPDRTIDPARPDGVTVRLTDRNGPVYAVTIPGLRWQLQPPLGSRWTYADPGGTLNGLRKASIKRVGKAGTGKGYKLDLRAVGIDPAAADFPSLDLEVAIARPAPEGLYRAQVNRTCVVTTTKHICK